MPRIPRWKRHLRATPRDRASRNGSRGETPCAGAGAALAPAQGCRGSPGAAQQNRKKKKKREFPGGMPRIPRWKRHLRATPRPRAITPANADSRRGTTSSDLAALGHLPLRGRLHAPLLAVLGRYGTFAQAASLTPHTVRYAGPGARPHPSSLRSATFP